MRKFVILTTVLITVLTVASATNFWETQSQTPSSIETKNYEIIVKDFTPNRNAPPGYGTLQPYKNLNENQKQTMIIEPASPNQLVKTCKALDAYNQASYSIQCRQLGR